MCGLAAIGVTFRISTESIPVKTKPNDHIIYLHLYLCPDGYI